MTAEQRAIDDVMSAVYGPLEPGASVVVVRRGQVIFRKGYGVASVELEAPMRPESVFGIASLTKQFTASAILKLVEQKKLALDDPLTKFLPNYPVRGAHITVEHLLTHTSGLSPLNETTDMRATATPDVKVADIVGDWTHDLPLDFTPGERWAYSNWGYTLLGTIVEKVSGVSYGEFLTQTFFTPFGMAHTYYTDRRRIIPGRVPGYEEPERTPFNILPSRGRSLHPAAAGGLLTTVDDLAIWNAAIEAGRVLPADLQQRMFTSYRLKDGTATNYGYGWDLGEYEGHRVQEHQGGTTGFLSQMVRLPDDGIFVAVLSNRDTMTVPVQATAHRVAAIALGRPIPPITEQAVAADASAGVIGTYRGDDVGTCVVTRDGPRFAIAIPGFGTLPLLSVGEHRFRTPSLTWTFTFDLDAAGRGIRLRVRDWKLNDVAVRVEPAPPAAAPTFTTATRAALEMCVGEYESLNGVIMTVTVVDDHLAVRPLGQSAVEVWPVSATEFATRSGDTRYTFEAGTTGAVARLLRSTGGRPVPARRLGGSR